jgi:aminoglycoside phosphotransferase (APT) family kinase protein
MELQSAALALLAELTAAAEPLQALYLQPDRAVFLAERSRVVLKAYADGDLLYRDWHAMQEARSAGVPTPELLAFSPGPPAVFAMRQVVGQPISSAHPHAAHEAGALLARFHRIGAHPPFSTGARTWDQHVLVWIERELGSVGMFDALSASEIEMLRTHLFRLCTTLTSRPIALLHGDLQPVHLLVDERGERIVALLDFAEVQAGDPLLDIAVLTLWDEALTAPILAGYPSLTDDTATRDLIAEYRLLRHISEIPWLLERGYTEYADRNIVAVRESIIALKRHHAALRVVQ